MTEKQLLEQEARSADASPAKSLGADLRTLRQLVRTTGRAYVRHLEGELDEISIWAAAQANEKKLPKSAIRDLGDMMTLVRKLDLKPAKGRRKDLKKLDATIGELREFLKERRTR